MNNRTILLKPIKYRREKLPKNAIHRGCCWHVNVVQLWHQNTQCCITILGKWKFINTNCFTRNACLVQYWLLWHTYAVFEIPL